MPRFTLSVEVHNVDAPSFSDAVEVIENALFYGFENRVESAWFKHKFERGDATLKVEQCK